MKKPLPLEGDMKYVWQKIQKVIDPLHISNHKVFLKITLWSIIAFKIEILKRPECSILYPPSKVSKDYPDANLMTCEELFAWLGRFKKILNSMTKNHCHFFLHRMVLRRNKLVVQHNLLLFSVMFAGTQSTVMLPGSILCCQVWKL